MAHILDTVDQLLDTLKKLQPLKPEDKARLDKKFRLEFNYNSNHIEGNTLTYGETELLLMFDDTHGNHSMREYEETKAHDVAYHIIEELAKDSERPLTEQIIKNLNETILVRPYWKDAITSDGQNTRRQIEVGSYKKYPNSVRLKNGEMFNYASPTETPILMQKLIDWYRTEQHAVHPVRLATMLHYRFVRIHPFDDGNGRIARLLMNYVLLKFNYPPVVIKSSDKDNYLRVLHLADVEDYEHLISYVAEQVVWSLETSIKAAKGESLEDKDDFIKEIELVKRKASSKAIPISPGVVYEAFETLNNKVWYPTLNLLKYFDALFNEVKNIHTVNNHDELFETKTVLTFDPLASFRKEVSQAPKKLKIFGHDVYELEVNKIHWEHMMYALRGASSPTDLLISLNANFNSLNYKVRLKAGSTLVYETELRYKETFLPADLEKMTDALKAYLLDFVKTHIN